MGEEKCLQLMAEKMARDQAQPLHHHHRKVVKVAEAGRKSGKSQHKKDAKKMSARAREVLELTASRMTSDERKRARWAEGEWCAHNIPTSSDEDTPGWGEGYSGRSPGRR